MSTPFSLEIKDGKEAETKVVRFKGELDEIGIEPLKAQLDPLLENTSIKKVIFDLVDLEFINSKGIGYLVSVHTHLTKMGSRLILARASERVMDVISLVGLTSIIPYFSVMEEALTA